MNIYTYNVSLFDTIHNFRENIRIDMINCNIVNAIAEAKKIAGNEYTVIESVNLIDVYEDIEKIVGSYCNDCFEACKKLQSLILKLTDARLISNPENSDKYINTQRVILNNIKVAYTLLLNTCSDNFHDLYE